MSDIRLPKVVGLTLCERLDVLPGTHGLSLVGTFYRLCYPVFPSPPQNFTAYIALYDGVGEGTIKLSILHLESEKEIYRYRKWTKFPGRQHYAHLELRVTKCIFPATGRYRLTLDFDGQEITDRHLDIFQE